RRYLRPFARSVVRTRITLFLKDKITRWRSRVRSAPHTRASTIICRSQNAQRLHVIGCKATRAVVRLNQKRIPLHRPNQGSGRGGGTKTGVRRRRCRARAFPWEGGNHGRNRRDL